MSRRVLVTGAAGKTGRAVTAAAARAGLGVRALLRPGSPAPEWDTAEVEVAVGDLDTGAGLVTAMSGCQTVYLIAPNVHPDEPGIVLRALEAAREAGVGRVVYHSVLHPYAPDMPHHLAKAVGEDIVRRSGLAWTVLQPCAYTQNLVSGQHPSELVVPYAASSRFSFVDLNDVADVAARVLIDEAHIGASYEVCGPVAASVSEVADLAGLAVREIDVETWRSGPGAQLSPYARKALAAMFTYYDRYGLVGNGRSLEWLLGRAPRSVAEVISTAWPTVLPGRDHQVRDESHDGVG
ncbi:MAG TPA: NAD(P)H-binding protein [Jiangellaceae bacterium]|nr:NAD(P)H-binding protein [Jiangellaceae bacterium]